MEDPDILVKPGSKISVRGYCRVSTQMQLTDESHSIEVQEKKIRDYATYKEYTIAKIYKDEAISGKSVEARPGLQELLKDIQTGEYLVVFSLSRLARNAREALNLHHELMQKGCYLIALDINIDTKTAHGRLMFTMMNGFNQFERENTGEKVSSVLVTLSREGKLKSKPPFGWKFVGKKKPFEKEPSEQATIEFMKREKANDPKITVSQMAKKLTEAEHKCRKAKMWYHTQLKKIMIAEGIIEK